MPPFPFYPQQITFFPSGSTVTQTTRTLEAVALDVRKLAEDVLLLVWNAEDGATRGLRAAFDGTVVPPPTSHTAIPIGGGRMRNLLACRVANTDSIGASIEVRDGSGRILASTDARAFRRARAAELDPNGLLAGFDGPARVRAVRFITDVCASIFQLGANPEFVANCRQLVGELSRRPGPLLPRCTLLDRHVLCTALIKPAMGERLSAVVVGQHGVRRIAHAPAILRGSNARRDVVPVAILLDKTVASPGANVIIFGDNGMACRQIADAPQSLPALDWLATPRAENAAVRRYLLDCLARSATQDQRAASLLRELQILGPQRGRVANDASCPAAAGADLMIATPGGLFLCGWIRDPHGLVEQIEVERGGRMASVPLHALTRFPHRKVDTGTGAGTSDLYSGFATFIPLQDGQAPDSVSRLFIRFRSNALIEVAEGPCLLPPGEAREAILNAIPIGPVAANAIAACIEPALESLHAAPSVAPAEIIDIGTPVETPTTSIIIPMSPDLDIVRCRIGMLATDPSLSRAEIIHIADRAQRRAGVEPLLRALGTAYGVPTRLVIVPERVDSGSAVNAAVQASRAPMLVLLGRGALPQGSGWLARLADFLLAHPRCGIVTPRLVFEDHSLTAAGAEFGADVGGAWDVRRLYQGFPCDFPSASHDAPVGAASAGCLVMRRSLFDLTGGFDAGYFGALRQSADFCAKVRSHGFEIWRAAEPVLLDLDIEERPGTHEVCAELDRRRLERRWRAALELSAAAPSSSRSSEVRTVRTRGTGRRRRRAA